MALALVATGSHPQPSAGHFCCTVGGCSCPLPDSGAASGPCTTANWQPICGPGSRRANSGQCRMIYLEAFSPLELAIVSSNAPRDHPPLRFREWARTQIANADGIEL